MTSKNIGYHTRLHSNNTVKVCGGSFGGALDLETANRLVKSQFTVVVKPSGRAVFVDREGREVSLYISVDAAETEAGKLALAADRAERAKQQQAEDDKAVEIDDLLSNFTSDQLLNILKAAK